MDVSAILNASEDFLKDMGLCKAGDRLSLRGFCTSQRDKVQEKENKRKRLLDAFLSSKRDKFQKVERSKKKVDKINPEKEKTRKVELGWKHFRERDETYVHVPLSKGGGTRIVNVSLSSNKMEVLRLLKSKFFPGGKSIYGKEEEMEFALGNFQNAQIGVTLKIEGKEVPFTIGNYIESYSLKNVRLYLLSKLEKSYSSEDESDNEDDYSKSMTEIDDDFTSEFNGIGSASSDYGLKKDDACSITKVLISTTEARAALKREQDKAYKLSLQADMQKRIALDKAEQATEHKKKVQEARAARVPNEPESDFITVRVRHPTLGLCPYRFPTNSLMSVVYDWAGSLSPDILDFTLCDPLGEVLLPSSKVVDRCTIVMTPASYTPSLSDSDNDIQFQGFGAASNNSHDKTLQVNMECEEQGEENCEM